MHLLDAVQRNRLYPNTFCIPSAENIANIEVGDYAKIGIHLNVDAAPSVERIWVQINTINENVFTGTLANNPVMHKGLFGDVVEFEDRHILDILKEGWEEINA